MDAGSLSCPHCGAPAAPDGPGCAYCGARLATVACPSCFGMIFAGNRHCAHCGAEVARVEVASADTRRCPRCAVALEAAAVGAAYLDECPGCAGVWVDVESFGRICASREQQAVIAGLGTPCHVVDAPPGTSPSVPPAEAVRYVPCPACGRLMNRLNFAHCSGVVVDLCKGHGVWFDRDELRRIVEFIRGGGMERARARELEAIAEERHRLAQARSALAVQQSMGAVPEPRHSVAADTAWGVLEWVLRG